MKDSEGVDLFAMPWLSGILAPQPGIEPRPPQGKCQVLTTGQPGNSLLDFVTILLLFYVLVPWPQGMWDLRSLTRD